MKDFFKELQRRRVYTVGVAYVVVAWLLLQVADTVLPIYDTPDWVLKAFTTLLFLGFPLALILSWAFDITPQGISRTPPEPEEQEAGQTNIELPSGPSIAVLPFRNLSGEADQDLFAAALTSDITTGLTRSSHLFVLAPGATLGMENAEQNPTTAGQKLGVSYLLGGTVQKSSNTLRVTAQLSEVASGVQLWSHNYDKELSAENLFAVQDDIREQIVATLSDLHGVIYSTQSQKNVHRPTSNLNAYECLSVALAYDKYLSEEYHLKGRESLERAVEIDPKFDEAWAHLSWIYTDEYVFGFNPLENPMERALEAAQKGVHLAPLNYHNHWLLSRVHYFMGQREQFLAATGKALELNASDGTTLGLIGIYTAWSGDWDRGLEMVRKAMKLNPNYPDYYHLAFAFSYFDKGDFAQAVEELRKGPLEQFPPYQVCLTAALSRLGRDEEAGRQVAELKALWGGLTREEGRASVNRLFPFQPGLVNSLFEGLQKAGL